MHYFAYGSNMSLARLSARVPSAVSLGHHTLAAHELRFHKAGSDGSAKCDAFHSGNTGDVVHGVLFDICEREKPYLDRAEGLGFGYDEKRVIVRSTSGERVESVTYFALTIDAALRPYDWYLDHVLVGAREASLPEHYIRAHIMSVSSIEDPDRDRGRRERALYEHPAPGTEHTGAD